MFNLKVLATGSSGNCYLLEYDEKILILDAGIPIKDINIGLDFNYSNVVGCIVTHDHSDHALGVKELKKRGIDVWQPYLSDQKIAVKRFKDLVVTCFDVPHDGVPNRGFLIENGEEIMIYATDFEYIKYNFFTKKINYMLIECNYIKEYVNEEKANYSHVLKGHASLDVTMDFIKANMSIFTSDVVICHISKENGDSEEMVKRIQKLGDFNVYVAEKGKEIKLTNIPFS